MLNEENSITLAELALPKFGYDPDDVTLTFVKIRENCVFRADTPDGPIVLRLHRPGYRSHQEVAAESEYIELLAEHGLPVVRLIPALSGENTVVVSDGELEVVVDAQKWLEGSRELGSSEGNEEGHLSREDFEMMGKILARMHDLAEQMAGSKTFDRVPWDGEGIVGEQALWGDALTVPGLDTESRNLLAHTRRFVLDEFERFGTEPAVYGTIHADFSPENVLVTDDGHVIIDFDDFGEGWYLFDIATALFFFIDTPEYEEFRAGILEGYRAHRALSTEEERLLEVFLVARGFTYLGWAATRPETETAQFVIDEIVPLVVRLSSELTQRA